MLSLATVLVASSMVVGQAPTTSGLQAMEPIIGTWVFKGRFPDELSSEVKKGDPMVAIGTYAWARNKNAVTLRVTIETNGKKIEWTDGIMVWDPSAKVIRGLDSYFDGGIAEYTIRVDGPTLVYQIKGTSSDGKPTSATLTDVFDGKDIIKGRWTNRKLGTESLEDWELVGHRVGGQTSIPDEARKSLGYYVGEWKGEWKQGEKKGTTTLSIKWAPGKHCTINQYVVTGPDGEFHGCVISGWDPDKKQVVDTGYESHGSTFEDRWTIKSDVLEEGGSKNTVPQEGVTKGQCRIEKIGPDEFTYTKINISSDGQKTLAFTGSYRRQSGAAK